MAMALAAAAWLYEGRGVIFFIDEWQWIIGRHSPNEASLLQPFNNHWMAVPIGIHQVLYRIVGIGSQVPYRLVLLAVHLTCAWLVFTYLRRRVPFTLALAAASVLAFYGFTWTVTLWPISLGWAIAATSAVGSLLLLDRDTRRADQWVAALLVVGVASTSVAVAFVVGIGAEIVLRRDWRRLWVVIAPVSVYGLWFLGYGSGTTEPGSVGAMLRFSEKLLAQTTATLLGVVAHTNAGRVEPSHGASAHVVLGMVGGGLVVLWWRLGRRVSPRLGGLVVALGAYTLVLALARAASGVTTWYSYPAAVLLLLVVGELLRDRISAPLLTVIVAAIAVWAVAWNVGEMGDAGRYLRAISRKEQAELTATDLVRSRVDLSFKPEGFFLRDVTAGAYFDVEGKFGSPAFSIDELRSSPRDARQAADGVIVRALNIHAQTAVALPQAARCDDVQAGAVVRVRSGIVFVQGATSVTVGVFDNHDGGPRWRSEPTNPVGSDQATRFDLPTLSGAPPWGLHIRGTGGARLCTLPSSAGGDL